MKGDGNKDQMGKMEHLYDRLDAENRELDLCRLTKGINRDGGRYSSLGGPRSQIKMCRQVPHVQWKGGRRTLKD